MSYIWTERLKLPYIYKLTSRNRSLTACHFSIILEKTLGTTAGRIIIAIVTTVCANREKEEASRPSYWTIILTHPQHYHSQRIEMLCFSGKGYTNSHLGVLRTRQTSGRVQWCSIDYTKSHKEKIWY